jgi:hypothetical protein
LGEELIGGGNIIFIYKGVMVWTGFNSLMVSDCGILLLLYWTSVFHDSRAFLNDLTSMKFEKKFCTMKLFDKFVILLVNFVSWLIRCKI